MTYEELQVSTVPYRYALCVERSIKGSNLHRLERVFRYAMAFFLGTLIVISILETLPFVAVQFPDIVRIAVSLHTGIQSLTFLSIGFWTLTALLYASFASEYFADTRPILTEGDARNVPKIRYEIAVVATTGFGDPTIDFFASRFGARVTERLNLAPQEVLTFLSERGKPHLLFAVVPLREESIGLAEYVGAMFDADPAFQQFCAKHEISREDAVGAGEWVSRMETTHKQQLRFWGRDALGRIPGIGKDWMYGETALLERFAEELGASSTSVSLSGAIGKREAGELERVLSRGREANVLLVGEAGVPKQIPLARLAEKIARGDILPPLEHKRMFVFGGTLFVSSMKDKNSFEEELIRILTEAVKAGNIIFVFDNFDTFVQGAKALGSDVLRLIDTFLTSPHIQIIAVAEIGMYHALFEHDTTVGERFEVVRMEGAGIDGSLPVLEDEALRAESANGVFFTFQAIRSIAESADRYFFDGMMPDKAVDLLKEMVPLALANKQSLIGREQVLELVSKKTGIKTGAAKGEERTQLLKLEEALHERIVGQDDAITAISGALRRARSGIGNPNRPMGSFLFLGPTGVGKTETTKALAQVFFNDEARINRLDMSEYQTDDALNRLIGTFENGKTGILSNMLRDRPYGVLLLDEFEKTNKDVHDIFLQILDEGFFTDATGKKVNARNLMIIATSNAASDMIWKQLQDTSSDIETKIQRLDPDKKINKDVIMTEIINRGIFRPELLNRFDGVVVFKPLFASELKIIAGYMLQKLQKRLKEKGLELVVNDTLLDYLVSVGQDPKFGARPMNRAIQESVEQVIAEKMLRGDIGAGSIVELTSADLH